MNSFGSYLLPPSTHNTVDNADEMQALFPHPQTQLPTELPCTDLTLFHSESAPPTVPTGTLAEPYNPMLMFYATVGVVQIWDRFLQDNAKGRSGSFHVTEYHVVRTVSPYFMWHPTKPSAVVRKISFHWDDSPF
jgi:hypothetical protein